MTAARFRLQSVVHSNLQLQVSRGGFFFFLELQIKKKTLYYKMSVLSYLLSHYFALQFQLIRTILVEDKLVFTFTLIL